MLPQVIREVCDGSTKEENVALADPPPEGGGYEDAPGSHRHLRTVREPETAAPRLHRSGGLRDLSRSNGGGNLQLNPARLAPIVLGGGRPSWHG